MKIGDNPLFHISLSRRRKRKNEVLRTFEIVDKDGTPTAIYDNLFDAFAAIVVGDSIVMAIETTKVDEFRTIQTVEKTRVF